MMLPDNDDKPVGRVLSRRELLTMLGSTGAAILVATGFKNLNLLEQTNTATPGATILPSCVVKPAKTEGPYFVDEMLNRSDIRIEPSDGSVKEGVPLELIFHVTKVSSSTCEALEGAQVDVWHCDALGVYSDVSDQNGSSVGEKWLRGYQVTDENGAAEFTTIYPGWYAGRTVHIHFKIRTATGTDADYEFTSQLFFDDDLTDQVYKEQPYASKTGERDTHNATDMHYADGGDQLLLDPIKENDGYTASFDIGLDLTDTATGASDAFSMQRAGGAPSQGTRPANTAIPATATATPTTSG